MRTIRLPTALVLPALLACREAPSTEKSAPPATIANAVKESDLNEVPKKWRVEVTLGKIKPVEDALEEHYENVLIVKVSDVAPKSLLQVPQNGSL